MLGQILQLALPPSHAVQGSVVVELGSGTGVAGIVAAALGAARVYLTDKHPELVDALAATAAANGFEDRCIPMKFEWSAALPPVLAEERRIDIVLAADTAYSPGAVGSLCTALDAIAAVASPPPLVLLAFPNRSTSEGCLEALDAWGWRRKPVPIPPSQASNFSAALMATCNASELGTIAVYSLSREPPVSMPVSEELEPWHESRPAPS